MRREHQCAWQGPTGVAGRTTRGMMFRSHQSFGDLHLRIPLLPPDTAILMRCVGQRRAIERGLAEAPFSGPKRPRSLARSSGGQTLSTAMSGVGRANAAHEKRQNMLRLECAVLAALLALVVLGPSVAVAQGEVSFKGKIVTMVIGSEAGGGTDATGRVIAPFLRKYLRGEPEVIIQNVPGASGVAAMNYFLRRTQPDGLSVIMTSNLTVDPLVYRNSGAQYDPKAFGVFGGVGRGGTAIFVSREAEQRLYNKSAAPVVIGTVVGMPRAAMQPAIWCIEYLGWNAKWVAGYHSTNEVMLAFDRGEIDMTSTGNIFQMKDRLNSGYLKIVNQSGSLENGRLVGRAEFGDAPLFVDQMKGKVVDPIPQRALDYWVAV